MFLAELHKIIPFTKRQEQLVIDTPIQRKSHKLLFIVKNIFKDIFILKSREK